MNFAEEVGLTRRLVICGEKLPRRAAGGSEMIALSDTLDKLWSDKFGDVFDKFSAGQLAGH